VLEDKMNSAFLDRGVDAPGIDLDKEWAFEPEVAEGETYPPATLSASLRRRSPSTTR